MAQPDPSLNRRALRSGLLGTLVFAALIFIPAGTLDYWQGWAFLGTFVAASAAVSIYLARHDAKLLERRMSAGPAAEQETSQKIIVSLTMVAFVASIVIPALDHRFGWSRMPSYLSVLGDLLIALGFLLIFFVFKANSYGASTIQIAEDHKVISTGPYAIVRHPMYAGALPILAGVPLALGSYWGLLAAALFLPMLIWRLLDEEQFLHKNLPGYTEYTHNVRYRLVPFVW